MVEITKGALGSEGSYALSVQDGKLMLTVSHAHASGSVSIIVQEDAGYFLDKLAALIPGTFDDVLIGLAKDALKRL